MVVARAFALRPRGIFGSQFAEDVAGDLAFVRLAHGSPVRPDASERVQRAALVRSEPHGDALPSIVSYSLKLVNGARQRSSGSSHRFQWLLLVLRMLVVPLSGSICNSSLKSTVLLLASSFFARFLVASMSACADLRPRRHYPTCHDELGSLGPVANDRRWVVREDPRHRRQVSDVAV